MKPRKTETRFAVLTLLLLASSTAASAGEHFKTIPAAAFQAIGTWNMTGLDSPGHYSRYCDGDPGCSFVVDAGLPHGATIVGLEIDACDNSGDWNLGFRLIKVNTNEFLTGGTEPHSAEIAGTVSSGCGFTTAESQARTVVNQFAASYLIVVAVEPRSPEVVICGFAGLPPCPGSASRFNALRIYYEPNPEGIVEPTKPLSTVFFP